MLWVVEIVPKGDGVNLEFSELVTFDNVKDLGIFLQNYDDDSYRIASIKDLYVNGIYDAKNYIKQDSNIEFGNNKED
jgi:hypothetical protein